MILWVQANIDLNLLDITAILQTRWRYLLISWIIHVSLLKQVLSCRVSFEMSDNQIMETTLIATDAGYVFPEDAISGGWIVHSRISDSLRLRPSLKINKADQRTEQPDRLLYFPGSKNL